MCVVHGPPSLCPLRQQPKLTTAGDPGRELGEGENQGGSGPLGDCVGRAPARRRSRGLFPPSPFCHELLLGPLIPALLAPGHEPMCGAVVRAQMRLGLGNICAGWAGFLPLSWGRLLLGGSLGCASPPRLPQPAVCIFGVPVCVYLPRMCLRLYLSGASVRVFVFPSAPSPQTWGKLLFLIRGQNCLVAMLAMAFLIRPSGNDLSVCSLRLGLGCPALGTHPEVAAAGRCPAPLLMCLRRGTKAPAARGQGKEVLCAKRFTRRNAG